MATQIKDTIIDTFKLDRENVDKVIAKIEELIHEGSIRRVIVKDARGVTIMEVPLTLGLVGVALVPVWPPSAPSRRSRRTSRYRSSAWSRPRRRPHCRRLVLRRSCRDVDVLARVRVLALLGRGRWRLAPRPILDVRTAALIAELDEETCPTAWAARRAVRIPHRSEGVGRGGVRSAQLGVRRPAPAWH